MTFSKREYRGSFTGWGSRFSIQGHDISNFESIVDEFRIDELTPEPEYVCAYYEIDGYEGSALLVYKTSEGWFMNHGSHCSCYGLEECWKPEPFEPVMHFEALKQNKRLFSIYNDHIENHFDRWLEWAVSN